MKRYIITVTTLIVLCFGQFLCAREDHRISSTELVSQFPLKSNPPSIFVDLECGSNPVWQPALVPFSLDLSSLDAPSFGQPKTRVRAVSDQFRTADVGGWITIAIAAYVVIFLLRPNKTDASPRPHKPPAAPAGGNAVQEKQ